MVSFRNAIFYSLVTFLFSSLHFFAEGPFIFSEQSSEKNSLVRFSLDGEWQFKKAGEEKWHPARVPGCVHTDLLDTGLIPDPFYRDNETKVQWIEKEDWEYRREFDLAGDIVTRGNVELVAKGLDTFAKIFINGEKIAETDNMFRGWRFEIKPFLRAGKNEVRILFESPVKRAKFLEEKLPYTLPGGSPHLRKAPYHFGWDWGPRLVTSGIWRSIGVEAWSGARIEELGIRQDFVEKNKVNLKLEITILADKEESAEIKAVVQGKKKFFKSEKILLNKGKNSKEISFGIDNPDLWWPAGMGEQNLYRITVELYRKGELGDSLSKRIGIRKLVLEQKDDGWGKSFRFAANGVPFFAKGGNWIPADSFPSRVPRQKYETLLSDCVEAEMNMLRVWGGGVYESSVFYDLCDELGIVVWQDFMFACAMFPGDERFLENVRKEAEYVVKELKHHPCLALWCGNNECEEGWFHWGWKSSLPAEVWEDYEKIFHQILPEAVRAYDPDRAYWPSSPHSEKVGDPRSDKSGDMHYWGIWHGKEPFKEYRKKFHRFMSEFGFQSFPLLETVKTFTLPEDWNITSPVMEHHQKHPEGNRLILQYMLDHYRLPKDFESLLWLSQVLQAEGMKTGVEHFRSRMPRIMGALYWQINDCWPVASWSGTDYFGKWKALHYYARRFYSPVLVAPVDDGKALNVYAISDRLGPVEAELRWAVLAYDGKLAGEGKSSLRLEPGESRIIFSQGLDELRKNYPGEEVFFTCELVEGNKSLSSNIFHFSELKRVSLPQPEIKREVSFDGKKIVVALVSRNFAKDVTLSAPGFKGRFSDNFFDMIPDKRYEVFFLTDGDVNAGLFEEALRIKSLRDS